MSERRISRPPGSGEGRAQGGKVDCRCVCNKLLARVRADGLELKCGRCERLLLVTLPDGLVIELTP